MPHKRIHLSSYQSRPILSAKPPCFHRSFDITVFEILGEIKILMAMVLKYNTFFQKIKPDLIQSLLRPIAEFKRRQSHTETNDAFSRKQLAKFIVDKLETNEYISATRN
jgi:hypothetical protein